MLFHRFITLGPGGLGEALGFLSLASQQTLQFMHWRRKWQPTPVFLPGESQGWGSLMGCCLWGRTELDMTEVTFRDMYTDRLEEALTLMG